MKPGKLAGLDAPLGNKLASMSIGRNQMKPLLGGTKNEVIEEGQSQEEDETEGEGALK